METNLLSLDNKQNEKISKEETITKSKSTTKSKSKEKEQHLDVKQLNEPTKGEKSKIERRGSKLTTKKMPAIEEIEDSSPLHVPQGILDNVEDMGSNTSKATLTVAETAN